MAGFPEPEVGLVISYFYLSGLLPQSPYLAGRQFMSTLQAADCVSHP